MLNSSPNGHLHGALLVALVIAFLTVLVVPIARSGLGGGVPSTPPVAAAGQGIASALRGQAGTVAAVMSRPGVSEPTPVRYAGGFESLPGINLIPAPLFAAAGQVAAGTVFADPSTRASIVIHRQSPVPFTVHEEGMTARHTSSQITVGSALADLGVRIGPHDVLSPPPDTLLTPGLHVYVSYASSVRLIMGGNQRWLPTHAHDVAGFLAEQGIEMEGEDKVFPGPDEPLRRGMVILVTVIRENIEFIEEPIPYSVAYEHSPAFSQGAEILMQAGADGYWRREYRVRYVNGKEVERELLSESLVPPVDAVVALGTRPPNTPPPAAVPQPLAVSAEGLNCVATYNVWATWYTAASAGGSGITATGTPVYKGIVAVDPAVIPLGTKMYIPGYGYGLAADTGGGIKGMKIDLGYGENDVKDWKTRWVDICILG
jgi:uncharacterized protein YabE (DUF348 family)/3D (Asp-Asp-Asp) domain-containing protein